MNPMSSDIGYTMTLYDAGKSWDGKSRAAVMARVVFAAPSDIDAEATVPLRKGWPSYYPLCPACQNETLCECGRRCGWGTAPKMRATHSRRPQPRRGRMEIWRQATQR